MVQCRHLVLDPVGQRGKVVQRKIRSGHIARHGHRLEGHAPGARRLADDLDLGPAAVVEALQQHQIVAVALKQGKQVLLVQAEFLGQQIAPRAEHGHTGGSGIVEPGCVRIGGVQLCLPDDAHFQPAGLEHREQRGQQRGLAAALGTADGQHGRMFEIQFGGKRLFLFTVQKKSLP